MSCGQFVRDPNRKVGAVLSQTPGRHHFIVESIRIWEHVMRLQFPLNVFAFWRNASSTLSIWTEGTTTDKITLGCFLLTFKIALQCTTWGPWNEISKHPKDSKLIQHHTVEYLLLNAMEKVNSYWESVIKMAGMQHLEQIAKSGLRPWTWNFGDCQRRLLGLLIKAKGGF